MATADRARVVIGDAVCETRSALAEALRDSGYEVVEAGDGAAILDYVGDCVETSAPVVVVADSRMPVLTGLHVLASLRDLSWVRVIVTAPLDDDRARRIANRLGAAAMFDRRSTSTDCAPRSRSLSRPSRPACARSACARCGRGSSCAAGSTAG
jgi:CheY-like chemotaxis protein